MPRPRHQDGYVEEVGHRIKKWKGHWYVYEKDAEGREIRAHRSKVLGLKRVSSSPDGRPPKLSIGDRKLPVYSKWEAERELQRIIAIATGNVGQTAVADSRVTFGWFWRNKWLPLREGGWRPKTRDTAMFILEHFVGVRWDTVPLREMQASAIAEWLNGLAKEKAHSTVWQCRVYLRSVLEEAVEEDYLTKNPARRVKMPETRKEAGEFLTMEQFEALMGMMRKERDRLMLALFVVLGLRPGELFALRWDDVGAGYLRVDESVFEGQLGKPKTAGSATVVALPEILEADIAEWRLVSQPSTEQAWVFPSRKKAVPIRAANWLKYTLRPAATLAKLPKINFQMLRRTFATLAHDQGMSPKIVQAQMRHTTIAMTMERYTKVISKSQSSEVDSFARKILKRK